MKKLIVMADYAYGLFLPDGATGPEDLGASEELSVRFNTWLARYREHDDAAVDFDRIAYNKEG